MKKLLMAAFCVMIVNPVWADVKITEGWIKKPVGGVKNVAAFMTISNEGDEDIRLLSVNSSSSEMTHLHDVKVSDGVVRMVPMDSLTVRANSQAVLKMGGLHVMLKGMKEKLSSGDWIAIAFEFDDGTRVTKQFEVKAQQAMSAGM
ncbi:MAG: copper chaperone PCu(A)C [Halopseudomonas sp.]